MAQNTILICAPPGDLRTSVETALADAGHRVSSVDDASAAEAAVRETPVDLIVADGLAVASAVGSLRWASAGRPTPIIVVAPADDVEARIAFLEAGADDVLALGFDEREMQARVEALLVRLGQIEPTDADEAAAGSRVIAFFGPKGGVGTTAVAVNTAVVLAQRNPGRVLLIDLDLQFGQVATHLNLIPSFDIAQLVADEAALRESDVALSFLVTHDSGLWVLAAPSQPGAETQIGPEHVEELLAVLAPRFEIIVVDCGSHLDPRVLTVLQRASTHVIVVLPELAALKAASSLMAFLGQTATLRARSLFAVNRIFPRELLKTGDVETLLQARVTCEIPYAEVHMIRAINEGTPIAVGHPSSPASAALRSLADIVTRAAGAEAEAPKRRGLFRRG